MMNLDEIKRHWETASQQFPTAGTVTPTTRDPYLGQLEEENLLSYLVTGQVALELGCGDGAHTVKYARRVSRITGLDLTADFIRIARNRVMSEGIGNAEFNVASVLDLKATYPGREFDCIMTQRCLINLPEWPYQQDALLQAHGLLKRGGLFLITEGFQDEFDNLNAVRRRFGLPVITCDYNRNFVREDFENFVKPYFEIIERRHYGAYLFLSRVLHPLAVLPEQPRHDGKLNQVALKIFRTVPMPGLEQFSYNLFYALRRR